MTLYDGFGAQVSHNDQADIDQFHQAAVLMLGFAPDPVAIINQVIEKAPDFIMARCFLAGMYLVASNKERQKDLAREYALLVPLFDRANERERGHIRAIKLWLEGDYYASSQAYADILFHCPRDLCALQFGHQTDFLLGHVSSTRDRPARVMSHWSEADPEFSFVLGMQAFGLEETGHYAQAEAHALRCVSLNPKDTWGVHALAHCYEMQGKTGAGISFMQNCEKQWGHDNYLSIHNRWHLSLYWIEKCQFEHVLKMHDDFIQVGADSMLMDIHDSAALLWRLHLDGVDVGDRWKVVADGYESFLDQAYMPFNDMHAMMAMVATGRDKQADALVNALTANQNGPTTSSDVIRLAGLPIVKGFQAFGRGDYETAKHFLSAFRHNSHLMGGSIAQRDVINLTLLEAAIRSGDKAMADGLIAERTLLKPESPLTDMFSASAARIVSAK
jgi:tetratricopeptide (TPR) repeat protein